MTGEKETSISPAPPIGAGLSLASGLFALVAFFVLRGPEPDAGDTVRFVGRFHTLLIHLPIGLLLLVATAEPLTFVRSMRERIDPMWGLVLPFLSITATASFTVGLLLAYPGGFPPSLLEAHKNGTFAGVLGCALLPVAWTAVERGMKHARHAFRGALLITTALLSLGAHHGGSMTRGEDYLVKHAPRFGQKWMGYAATQAPPEAEEAGAEPLLYDHVVAPILKAKCVKCHGSETQKGGLRVDDIEKITLGGENGAAIVRGQGETSLLVSRMRLPRAHDERMPPADEPDVTEAEIALIAFWIERGAEPSLRVKDSLPPDEVRELLKEAVKDVLPGSARVPSPSSRPETGPPPDPTPTTEPGPTESPEPPSEGLVYRDIVAPFLSAKCESCHGAEKQKRKLRVDSIDALLKGGKGGPAIVVGNSDASTLVSLMRLPIEHVDHMPPKKDPQPSEREIETLALWIKDGASESMNVAKLPAHLRGAKATPTTPATSTSTSTVTSTPTTSASTATSTPPAEAPEPDITFKNLPVKVALFEDVVSPMLVKKCGLCHEGTTGSGSFRVAPLADLLKGGDSGPGVVPNDVEKSLALARIHLPVSSDEHMPPRDLSQLTRSDVAAFKLWVSRGAKEKDELAREDLPASVFASVFTYAPQDAPSVAPSASASASTTVSASPSGSAAPTTSASGPPPVPPNHGGCAGCATSHESTKIPLALVSVLLALGLLRSVCRPKRLRLEDRATTSAHGRKP